MNIPIFYVFKELSYLVKVYHEIMWQTTVIRFIHWPTEAHVLEFKFILCRLSQTPILLNWSQLFPKQRWAHKSTSYSIFIIHIEANKWKADRRARNDVNKNVRWMFWRILFKYVFHDVTLKPRAKKKYGLLFQLTLPALHISMNYF